MEKKFTIENWEYSAIDVTEKDGFVLLEQNEDMIALSLSSIRETIETLQRLLPPQES